MELDAYLKTLSDGNFHEIIVFGCFKSLFYAKTTSPGPEMFVRFRNFWPLIEKTDFKKLEDVR
jgi:hypothetical protein